MSVSNSLLAQGQFIENKGQWDPQVKYMTKAGDGSFFLQEKGYTISQYDPQDLKNYRESEHGITKNLYTDNKQQTFKAHAYSVEFVDAQIPEIIAEKPLDTYNNYFIGNDKSKWASNCKIYQIVLYKNIYPGVDLRYYVDNGSNLKYDLIIHPGGDVNRIAMRYNGLNKLEVKKKELILTTSLGTSKELKPYTYQNIDNQTKEVECRYEIKDNVVRFKVKNYSPDQTLIIDPTYIFFSYSGSTDDNWGFTATYGKDGSMYGGGLVFGGGFPTSPGSYQANFGGIEDIGIIKLSADGTKRIYATYLGGGGREQPHSLIEDPNGNLIMAGRTNSINYPTTATFGSGGGYDIVVTKLNATGTNIIGSMQIGGSGVDGVNIVDRGVNHTFSLKRNYGDDARSEVILDAANNIYLASSTQSTDFPTTAGAFQGTLGGMQDAVVLKLNPNCNNVIFST
ncbi:MAG: hypothetical protein ABI208_09200, partial [Ginsengibacter sp.]